MKLVKTTKKHYIYELNEKEINDWEKCKYLVFSKADYQDYKPNSKYDIGYEIIDCDTLDEAICFSSNY